MEKHFDQWSSCDDNMEIQIDSSHDETCVNAERSFVYNSIPLYSEEEAQALAKRLDNDETFKEAMKILIAWLERGECNEINSACFYFLIRLCWNRVEKLQVEEKEYQEKIKRLKKSVVSRSYCIQLKLIEIEEIFSTIEKQNLWTCFTQDHLEKIQEMREDLLNFKRIILEDCVLEKESDDKNIEDEQAESSVHEMQAKLGSLTSELDIVYEKTEEMPLKYEENKNGILRLRIKKEKFKAREKKEYLIIKREEKPCLLVEVAPQSYIDKKEIHVISLISIFLFEFPNEAVVKSIYFHLKKCFKNTNARFNMTDVENLLRKYPNIFKETRLLFPEVVRKWSCISITPETRKKIIDKKLHIQKLPTIIEKKLPNEKVPNKK
ncbi:ecto-NOX disulfide-thiol exchanger 1-like [Argiope bruennichi]|uniref:ecto-NOX disulfide-thiol exchanger 1-like n=1 Tax=Argiope bruennichi TaxID=94029 RepID=UPI00249487A8|nr:ecto-NOX disulfide-thiol exchanger 1-like [Argiope bruennichi]